MSIGNSNKQNLNWLEQKNPALQGKIAVVTGAASGIGFAVANELNSLGANVVALDINPEIESQIQGRCRLGMVCDIRKEDSIQSTLQKVVQHFGGLDILVNNAGTFPAGKPLDQLTESEWLSVLMLTLWPLANDESSNAALALGI